MNTLERLLLFCCGNFAGHSAAALFKIGERSTQGGDSLPLGPNRQIVPFALPLLKGTRKPAYRQLTPAPKTVTECPFTCFKPAFTGCRRLPGSRYRVEAVRNHLPASRFGFKEQTKMKLRCVLNVPFRRRLLGAAIILTSVSAFGQTLQLTQPAESGFAASSGEYLVVPELPEPQWRDEMGAPVARLRLTAPNAAAWSVAFHSLNLGESAQMFLYGINGAGMAVAVHGPYKGEGPLNVPGFQTRIIEGAELMIEVRGGRKSQIWPFTFDSVERIDGAQLAALKEKGAPLEAVHRPKEQVRQASETRYAWFDDELVPYQVIDGMAIMGGDIVLGPVADVESGDARKKEKRDGAREAHEYTVSTSRWPNGVMPYTIQYDAMWPATPNGPLYRGSSLESAISNAIAHWNEKFPGMLVQRTTQADYVTFRGVYDADKHNICLSRLGRMGGQQFITLEPACSSTSVIHEIGHALGMDHEHQRPDRDKYITINWQNIRADMAYAFEIPAYSTRTLGEYDFGSIMHYGRLNGSSDPVGGKHSFSYKVQPPEGVTPGQAKGLSTGDVAGIRSRYCDPGDWKITPTSILADGNGGSYAIAVTAPPYCTWTASESVSWLSVPTGIRTGSGNVSFDAFPNFGPARFTYITIRNTATSKSKLVRVDQPLDPHNSNK